MYLAAAVQMTAGANKPANRARAEALVERAVRRGAELVVLPELFDCLHEPETMVAQAEDADGLTARAMQALAARLRITLVAGSFTRRLADGRAANTSLVFGPEGDRLASYDKMHLFDVEIPGQVACRESAFIVPGEQIAVTDTPHGRLGQAICYDLRFPELFRAMSARGAEVLAVPAAFVLATGRDHWEVLLRARAIENQAFVVAANQIGQHTPKLRTYGRSMIVDPWGTVLAVAPDSEGLALAEIDLDRLRQIRHTLPALRHRRLS